MTIWDAVFLPLVDSVVRERSLACGLINRPAGFVDFASTARRFDDVGNVSHVFLYGI